MMRLNKSEGLLVMEATGAGSSPLDRYRYLGLAPLKEEGSSVTFDDSDDILEQLNPIRRHVRG